MYVALIGTLHDSLREQPVYVGASQILAHIVADADDERQMWLSTQLSPSPEALQDFPGLASPGAV